MTISAPPKTPPAAMPWTENDLWPRGTYLFLYLFIGLLAGIASALLGIGSGVIIVPILSGFLRVPMRRAIGISIVTVFGVVVVGVATEAFFRENIRWMLALYLIIGAQLGVWIGGKIGPKIPERALRYAFIALLAFTAAKLAGILPGASSFGLFRAGDMFSPAVLLIFALGTLAGTLSVLLGIGGGVVAVPGLLLLVEGLAFRAARATSLAMIVPTALTGTYIHVRQKNVLWRSVAALVIPGFFGAVAGVVLANIVPGGYLRQIIFPLFLCVMIVRLARVSGK